MNKSKRLRSKRRTSVNADYVVKFYKSNRNISLSLIKQSDNSSDKTLVSVSSHSTSIKELYPNAASNCQTSIIVAEVFAKKVSATISDKVAFDRNGYRYHGKVKAAATKLRENSIIF